MREKKMNSAKLPALTDAEKFELGHCEEVIEAGKQIFVEVGTALQVIRDKRLYRESHKTFGSYVMEKWGYHRSYAYRLIEAAGTVGEINGKFPHNKSNKAKANASASEHIKNNLSPTGDKSEDGQDPELAAVGERVLRALRKVPKSFRLAVWEECVRTKDEHPITSSRVVEVACEFGVELLEEPDEGDDSDYGIIPPEDFGDTDEPADGGAAEEAAIVADILGNPIPEGAHDVFADGKELPRLSRELTRITQEVERIAGLSAGVFLHLPSFKTDMANCQRNLKQAQPSCVCPYCKCALTGECAACRGTGLVPKSIYDAAPTEKRA